MVRVVATGPWSLPGWADALWAAGVDVVTGVSIDESPQHRYPPSELAALCAGSDAVLVSSRERFGSGELDAAPDLRLVAKATIGTERIDLEAATARGVLVTNAPAQSNFVGLAEATVGLIVTLAKQVRAKERRLRDGHWRDATTTGMVLAGRTIGILGLGRVGGNVARRLTGWDVRLLATDPYVEEAHALAVGATLVPLDRLLTESDVVTVHVPLTPETRGLLSRERLATMRPGAILINTSRGPVLDEAAVTAAVDSNHLGGVALDVFHAEPLPADDPLRRLDPDRTILTPHAVGSSMESRAGGTRMAVEAILSALSGVVPPHVVNPDAIPAWRNRWQR